MILVTAGYGTQARALIPLLAAGAEPVRAVRRRAAGAQQVRDLGAQEVMTGDLLDPTVLAAALRGVRAVFHVGPTAHPRESEMGVAVIDAAVAAGVEHVVYASVLHARISALVQHREKQVVEEHLVGAGVPFTILQPADFMESLNDRRALRSGVFELIWSLERAQTLVSVADVAAVAAAVLREGAAHHGATYELCAPGAFTAHDIAELLTRITGSKVRARRLDASVVAGLYAHADDSEGATRYRERFFAALVAWYDAHDFVGNPRVLRMLLGREPTTLEAFLRERRRQFEATV